MSPTLQSLMLHDTGGAALSRTHAGGTLGHASGSGPGVSGQAIRAGGEGGTPEFDPSRMEGEYTLDLEKSWDAWVRRSMAWTWICSAWHGRDVLARVHVHVHVHAFAPRRACALY